MRPFSITRARVATVAACVAAALVDLIVPARLGAEVSADVRSLPFRRGISIDPALEPGGWLEVWEDDTLTAHARSDFGDLRIMTGDGRVVPVIVRPPRLHDETLAPWMSTPVVWERGASNASTFAIELETAPDAEVVARFENAPPDASFELQASESGATWFALPQTILSPTIAGGSAEKLPLDPAAVRLVSFGTISQRHLRLVATDPEWATDGIDLTLLRRTRREAPVEPTAYRLASQEFSGRTWRAELELGGPARAVCRVAFAPDAALAFRRVTVETKTEEEIWRRAGGSDATALARSATLLFEPQRTRLVRLSVEGSDPPNAPVVVAGVGVTPYRLGFRVPEDASELWLAYGDALLEAPAWAPDPFLELANEFHRAALGPPSPNPYYREAGPGLAQLRRHPQVLTVTMLVLLGLLGWLVFRWRGAPSQSTE